MSDGDQRIEDERIIINYIDLQNRLDEMLEFVEKTNRPIFIERDGKIALVLMSIEHYKQQQFNLVHPIPEFEQTD